jgi:hypothetical protein
MDFSGRIIHSRSGSGICITFVFLFFFFLPATTRMDRDLILDWIHLPRVKVRDPGIQGSSQGSLCELKSSSQFMRSDRNLDDHLGTYITSTGSYVKFLGVLTQNDCLGIRIGRQGKPNQKPRIGFEPSARDHGSYICGRGPFPLTKTRIHLPRI